MLHKRFKKLVAYCETGTWDKKLMMVQLDCWILWLSEGKLIGSFVTGFYMLVAGLETTSSTATFLLHELPKNPD